MSCCCAEGCQNGEGSGRSFFRFPRNPEQRKIWESRVGREGWRSTLTTVLCSDHFVKTDYEVFPDLLKTKCDIDLDLVKLEDEKDPLDPLSSVCTSGQPRLKEDNPYPRQLIPKTTHTQDNSYPRQLVPKTTRTQERQLAPPKTTCPKTTAYPRQLILPRQLVPKTTHAQDNSQDTIPKTTRTQDNCPKTTRHPRQQQYPSQLVPRQLVPKTTHYPSQLIPKTTHPRQLKTQDKTTRPKTTTLPKTTHTQDNVPKTTVPKTTQRQLMPKTTRQLVPKTTPKTTAHPKTTRYPRQLVPKTTRTQDNSYPRQLVPKTTHTQDNSYPRQLVDTEQMATIKEEIDFEFIEIKEEKLDFVVEEEGTEFSEADKCEVQQHDSSSAETDTCTQEDRLSCIEYSSYTDTTEQSIVTPQPTSSKLTSLSYLRLLSGGVYCFYAECRGPHDVSQHEKHSHWGRPGPQGCANIADTPEKCQELFLDEDIIQEIEAHANIIISVLSMKFSKEMATIEETSIGEIKSLFGILIFSGCRHDNHLSAAEMWHQQGSRLLYQAVMSERCFFFLLRCLDFDNSVTRSERKMTDRLAPI
ncbi:THAP domain-containing protein 4-like 1 [Homarus americanus]|uniref:THAP domain-containing protein 4-like 1 n=1 Tax=Homarus americanus TaxID=6706 RepID=A0A8J5TQA3_HOMAM|nr:THAP domain-containing protein 4-like 1 [Homarus americanus]